MCRRSFADFDSHVGLGVKCAKEVATAIRGAIIVAKLSVVPSDEATGVRTLPSPTPSLARSLARAVPSCAD